MEKRWFDAELSGCRLGDGCLDRRLRQLVERMEVGFGESIPLACQDWASTKAAYRFFSNERVSEEAILRGHFDATRHRFAASDGPILVLHDTTEFSWRRKRPEAVGFTTTVNSGRDKAGRDRLHPVCGLLMHSSLAVTTDGLPLGMAAVKFWNRKKFKGTGALKRKINPTRVPIGKRLADPILSPGLLCGLTLRLGNEAWRRDRDDGFRIGGGGRGLCG